MSDPARILAIRMRLHLGQSVRFLDPRPVGTAMLLRTGHIVATKDTQLTVHEDGTRREWKLPYAAIEPPEASGTAPQPEPQHAPPRPTREHFRTGDRVSFDDRHLHTRIGTIVRINQCTATVDCDGHSWRVSFALLRHIVDL